MTQTVRHAEKTRSFLDIDGDDLQGVRPRLPLLRIRGARPGPLAVCLAAQHGRELNGIVALAQAFAAIDPEAVSGDIVFLPVMNPLAVRTRRQDYPIEEDRYRHAAPAGSNMNRTWCVEDRRRESFAGRVTEKVWRDYVRHADLLLDLHGWQGLSMAWSLRRHSDLLLAFGLPWNLIHKKPPAAERGMLETAAVAAGIPCVTAEFMPQNRICTESVRLARRGVVNLLRYRGLLPGTLELPAEQYMFTERHIEQVVTAPCEGLLESSVQAGQFVERGERVLTIHSLETLEPIFEYRATRRALVFSIGETAWGEDLPASHVVSSGQMVAILKVVSRTVRNQPERSGK